MNTNQLIFTGVLLWLVCPPVGVILRGVGGGGPSRLFKAGSILLIVWWAIFFLAAAVGLVLVLVLGYITLGHTS